MKKIRAILLVLCFAMVLPLLVACGNTEDERSELGDKYVYDDSSRERAADSIPEDYDLLGETISMFYSTSDETVIGDSETTDIVYSKIHERNLSVEERLNVELDFQKSDAIAWTDNVDIIKREIQTMSTAWEAVFTGNNVVIQYKLFNYFHNMNDSEYIDIDERWWYADAIEELSVDNYNYRFLYGDIHIGAYGCTGVIFYNKDYYEQYLSSNKDREEPYYKVLDGKWTFEEFTRLTKKAHIERGGDGSNDIHGFSLFRYAEQIHYLRESCGIRMYERNDMGIPEIDFMDEKSVDFTNKLYSFIYENEGAWLFYPNRIGEEEGHEDDFPNGKVMFLMGTLSNVLNDNMREMKTDFGVLPYPKWDEEQEEYRNFLHNSSTLLACPVSADYDRVNEEVSAVIEALASESYRRVSVAYYETALKTAYTRDDLDAQMIDIVTGQHDTVKSTLSKNFLYEYSWAIGGIGNIFYTMMRDKSTNFASTYDSLYYTSNLGIKELIQQYKDGKI